MTKSLIILKYFILFIIVSTYNPYFFKKNIIFFKFFNVTKINIEKNFYISSEEIKEQINHLYGKNIFTINKFELEKRIKKINFVNDFKVKKVFPNEIYIEIEEENPIGIVNIKKKKFMITETNRIIDLKQNFPVENLPQIFGINSDKEFLNFLNLLKINNFPHQNIKNYFFFKVGRWDIHLKNDKIIKFPYENINEAIKKSLELINNKEFKKYTIIDLRIKDKIITQ